MCVCVRACARAIGRVRACMLACVPACVYKCVCVCASVRVCVSTRARAAFCCFVHGTSKISVASCWTPSFFPPSFLSLRRVSRNSLSGSLLFASMSASRLVAYSVERREMQIGDSAISTFSPVGSLSSNGLRVCVFAFSVYSTGIARS